MTRLAPIACCLLAACAATPPAATVNDVTPLVDGELAFAAHTAAHGWNAGVRSFAAPDAVVADPLPINAYASLAPADDVDAASPLQWRPAFAGMADSGDLGFTTGPWFLENHGYGGHYFTVWRRAASGEWQWIFDGGVKVLDDAPQAAGAAVARLSSSARGRGAARALAAVRELESTVARLAATDAGAALAARLGAEVHLNRAAQPRAVGTDAARAVLARSAVAVRYEPAGAVASRAGDLVFTYGRASRNDGAGHAGSYARIWQLQPGGWRIVYDQIVPPR